MPKLIEHLLPRIKEELCSERGSNLEYSWNFDAGGDRLLFKDDRLYRHRIFRVNYTTYDIQRAQDVIHPDTSHRDIMVLNAKPNSIEAGNFSYARVLAIYHIDVIYCNANGAYQIHRPRRMEFLWVRWFQVTQAASASSAWDTLRLEQLAFPTVNSDDAFGFVNPADVLRGCHILPRGALGKVHKDGCGISHCAQDAEDWKGYYVNRCVLE